jgi:hypothetical protein
MSAASSLCNLCRRNSEARWIRTVLVGASLTLYFAEAADWIRSLNYQLRPREHCPGRTVN